MYLATIAVLMGLWLAFWLRFRDPFHPLIVILPIFAFLYGYMPYDLQASDPQRFWTYSGGSAVYTYQAITGLLILSLVGGVMTATRTVTPGDARWQMLHLTGEGTVRWIGTALGVAGMLAWLYMINSSGGFLSAYGSAYGGGWTNSGYLREMRFIGLGGALIIYMTRVGRGMRPIDWVIVLLCVSPTLIHALLGARRGPAFLALVALFGGYAYFSRTKIPLPLLLAGGACLGLLLLFLVSNRGSIYIGSTGADFRDPLEFLDRWTSNEYLIGGAVVRYAEEFGAFYGMRELTWIIARLMPTAVWPTIYTDLPAILGVEVNLGLNSGVSQAGLTAVIGWSPTVGSAEGFTGSLWLEFGVLAPLAAFAIGTLYGHLWKAARSAVAPRVLYLLAIALSVYLVMQSLDPWLYRLIMLGLPVWLVLRFVRVRQMPRHPRVTQMDAPPALTSGKLRHGNAGGPPQADGAPSTPKRRARLQ